MLGARVGQGPGPSTGRIGSRLFPYLVGRVGSNCVGLIQNVTLSVIVKFTFNELLIIAHVRVQEYIVPTPEIKISLSLY